jgi:hypothetical protein
MARHFYPPSEITEKTLHHPTLEVVLLSDGKRGMEIGQMAA